MAGYHDSGLGSDQMSGDGVSGSTRPVAYLWNVDVSGGDRDLLRMLLAERVGREYSPTEIDNLLDRPGSSFTLSFWDETAAQTFAELARETGATAEAYETKKINMIG